MLGWYRVPALGFAHMEVINAVQVDIFCMPGKHGPPHTKVQHGGGDTYNRRRTRRREDYYHYNYYYNHNNNNNFYYYYYPMTTHIDRSHLTNRE